MSVADVMSPAGRKTPIEKASATKDVVDEFEHVELTMTTAAAQSSLERLLSPHSRRESTECAVVMAYQPIAAATSPPAFQGEIKTFAYPYWLTTALTEPVATGTFASFEAPFRYPPPSSALRELVAHFVVSRPEPKLELDLGGRHLVETSPGFVLEVGPERVVETEPDAGTTRAYRAFVELADWLGLTQAQTADVLGMGRTTPLAWKREGHEPQPARARRLYQTHALVSTLLRRLGREEMRRWMESGNPSPLNLIAEGDVTGADDLADELIFGTPPSRERRMSAWVDEPIDAEAPTTKPAQDQPRRVRRRPPRRRTP